jgi:rare lipoprotein A
VILFLFLACATAPPAPPTPKGHPKPYRVDGTWYKPMPHARDFSQQGIASWYGKKFHGRKTSSGEVYNMYAMTAAHKTLPLGTWVRVRRLDSGKQIVVRVNDRGPFVHGRIIDLSYTAAKQMGMVGAGTARVEIVALGERRQTASGDAFVPMDYYNGAFTFQVGAFSSRANAERLRAKLDRPLPTPTYTLRSRRCHLLPGSGGPLQTTWKAPKSMNGTWPGAGIRMPLLWPSKKWKCWVQPLRLGILTPPVLKSLPSC